MSEKKTLRRVSQKLNHMMLPPSVGAAPGKQSLDFGLGLAILRCRKVSVNTKYQAALWGGIITLSLAQLELVLCHLLQVGAPHSGLAAHSAAYVFGMTLFTVLAAIRLAPHEDATRLRYERLGVIPIKQRSQPVEHHAERITRRQSNAGYTVIPRKKMENRK